MKIVIPDNIDPDMPVAVNRLVARPSNHRIGEIYGKPTKNTVIGSGRANMFFEDLTSSLSEKTESRSNRTGPDKAEAPKSRPFDKSLGRKADPRAAGKDLR
jgi:hypothetical protein